MLQLVILTQDFTKMALDNQKAAIKEKIIPDLLKKHAITHVEYLKKTIEEKAVKFYASENNSRIVFYINLDSKTLSPQNHSSLTLDAERLWKWLKANKIKIIYEHL